MPCSPKRPCGPSRGDRGESDEGDGSRAPAASAIGLPGASAVASHLGASPIKIHEPAPRADDERGREQDREFGQRARRQDRDQERDAQVHDRASPARSRPAPPPRASSLPSRCASDWVTAVELYGAANHRGGDRAVALAEDAVGDIAEEREAGDEHDHQPQLLRIPRAERPIMAAGQERQDRARDDRVAGERLDVVLVEPVDEAVKLGAQARAWRPPPPRRRSPTPGSPIPARKPMRDRRPSPRRRWSRRAGVSSSARVGRSTISATAPRTMAAATNG